MRHKIISMKRERKEPEQLIERTNLELYNANLALTISNKKLKVLLKKEQELNALKSSFISMASHQFRTPLAIIQSNAELLEMFKNDSKEFSLTRAEQITSRIVLAVKDMNLLMDEVLKLGQLSSRSVKYSREDIHLNEFCKKLVRIHNKTQPDGRILEYKQKGESYLACLDKKLLEGSLSNLISNAFKYSQGRSNPKLELCYKSKSFSITISDNGLGVPKKCMQKLTLPFYRGGNVAGIKGAGLGLSICKEYVELNNGQLLINSVEGQGSNFKMEYNRSVKFAKKN